MPDELLGRVVAASSGVGLLPTTVARSSVGRVHWPDGDALTPRLDVVLKLVESAERAGVQVAVGGSALLAARGVLHRVRDWDLTTDAEPDIVAGLVAQVGLPHRRVPREDPFLTEACYTINAGDHSVDVLCQFAVRTPRGVLLVPTATTDTWRGMPLANAQAWSLAYRALGRPDRADALTRALAQDL